MNWLGHLRVAPTEPLVRLGNLMGDFLRGIDPADLPPDVQAGIAQHRALDRFTDAHPVFRRSRSRLAQPFRRLSGVLVDVFYDHFLAKHWERWGDGRPLPVFTGEVYGLLREHRALLTPRLRQAAVPMTEHDWLGSYRELELVDETLARMGGRLRRPTPLGEGGRELRLHYDGLHADFESFFPDALTFASAMAGGGS